MPTVPAKVIPEPKPKTKTVLVPTRKEAMPVFIGSGKTNYTCGNCKSILVRNIFHGQLSHLVIKCAKCGTHNEIP